ncbi:hypothetical protein TNCV_1726741 [Trichonephila clavipes]|nr:hypothetical protein TNCV_1726741 [Trichonephila clavipes]
MSQFERGRITGMMEADWSARQVARQLRRSGCVEQFFNKTMLGLTRQEYHKAVSALLPPFLLPCPILKCVPNRAYLGIIWDVEFIILRV